MGKEAIIEHPNAIQLLIYKLNILLTDAKLHSYDCATQSFFKFLEQLMITKLQYDIFI